MRCKHEINMKYDDLMVDLMRSRLSDIGRIIIYLMVIGFVMGVVIIKKVYVYT